MARLRLWAFFLLVLLFAFVDALPAQAHAILLHSVPDADATLNLPPAQVDLLFSQAVEPGLSKIFVYDSSNRRVDANNTRLDANNPSHLIVSLNSLPHGVYIVSWNVISSADGHQTAGSFPFAVGQENQNLLAGVRQTSSSAPTPGEVATKGLLYLAAAMLMGSVLFSLLVWTPSVDQSGIEPEGVRSYPALLRPVTLAALLVLGIVDILAILLQAGEVDHQWLAWPWQPSFLTLLFDTRIGVLGIARLALVIALAGLLLPPANSWNRLAGLIGCLALLLTFSLESHAAAEPQPFLPVLADWVHLTAASTWIGGLFSFLVGMWVIRRLAPEPRTCLTSTLIPHFSNLALSSVAILALTGVYSAYLRIGSLEALFSTEYGRALVIKLLIALPMLILGAIHFLFTTPAMRQGAALPGGKPGLVSRFGRLLSLEFALGVLLLVWVAFFTDLPPVQGASTYSGYSQTRQADDLSVFLNIDPGLPGSNTFTVQITSGGGPVADAKDVSLEVRSLSMNMPESKFQLTNQGGGKYSQSGWYLYMADQWDLKVVVIRPGKFDAYADYRMDMSQTAPTTSPPSPWRHLAAGCMALLAISYAFSWKVFDGHFWRWIGLGLIPACLLLILAGWVFMHSSVFP